MGCLCLSREPSLPDLLGDPSISAHADVRDITVVSGPYNMPVNIREIAGQMFIREVSQTLHYRTKICCFTIQRSFKLDDIVNIEVKNEIIQLPLARQSYISLKPGLIISLKSGSSIFVAMFDAEIFAQSLKRLCQIKTDDGF